MHTGVFIYHFDIPGTCNRTISPTQVNFAGVFFV